MEKYRIADETTIIELEHCTEVRLFRIEAVRDFADVKKGDKGGWIQSENNLSHAGNCWVYDDAAVIGDAYVYCDAIIQNKATIYGGAVASGSAIIKDNAIICGSAHVSDYAVIEGESNICENATVFDNARVKGKSYIGENAIIGGHAVISNSIIKANVTITGKASVNCERIYEGGFRNI